MRSVFTILACLYFTVSLHAGDPLNIRITADSDPLATVAGCVNTLSGEFFYVEHDIESHRVGGLNYTRVNDNGSEMPNVLGYGWGSNFAKNLYYFKYKDKTGAVFTGNSEYDLFPFCTKEQKKGLLSGSAYKGMFLIGYTNSIEDLLMGEPSFSRTQVICRDQSKKKAGCWEVKLPNGTVRKYERRKGKIKYENCSLYRYRLIKENLPNGHIRHYSYLPDSSTFQRIWVTNADGTRELDSLTFSYGKKKEKNRREIQSACGKVVSYDLLPVCINEFYPGTVVSALTSSKGSHSLDSSYTEHDSTIGF